MTTSDKIAEAMFELVTHAPDHVVEQLTKVVKEFKENYPQSYSDVMRKQPITRAIFESIEEAERYINDVAA